MPSKEREPTRITDRTVAALKPKANRYEVWEEGRTGFGVRVAPTGRKTWVFMYRFGGRARRLTVGTYPALSLAEANLAVAAAKLKLSKGIDPGWEAVEERKAERRAETVEELIEEYLERWARPRKRTADEDERCLHKDVLPKWGRRKAKDITRRDVILLVDQIAERGAPIMANRTLAMISKMFGFAIDRDILQHNPCHGVRAPAKAVQRDRILSEAEIKQFWPGLDKGRMIEQMRLALKFMLVTAQRRGEVVEAGWSEFNIGNRTWTISADRSKNGMAHVVPLSDLALALLGDIRSVSDGSRNLFPSPRGGGKRPIVRTGVNQALRLNLETIGVFDITPHDLRRTAASHMTALGISRLVVSKVLNHSDRSVTAIYDRHSYHPEKVRALEVWGQRLSAIVRGENATTNVVLLPGARQEGA